MQKDNMRVLINNTVLSFISILCFINAKANNLNKRLINSSKIYFATSNDSSSIEKIAIYKIVWGHTDCLERVLIDSSGVYQVNCNDASKRLKSKKRINVDTNNYLGFNEDRIHNMQKIRKTKENHYTKYTYFIVLFMKNKQEKEFLISLFFKYDTLPSTEAEKDMYYINQLFKL